MTHNLFCLSIFAVVVTGCNQPSSDTALAELKKSNAEFSDKLDTANKHIKDTETQIAALQAEMNAFTQGYDSDKREQLAKNIKAVEQLLVDIRQDTESATMTLKEIQALKDETQKLKDLCVKHESEARNANQIGQVKTSVASLEQSVKKIEQSLGPTPSIGVRFRQLESKVRQLESKVRRLR